MSDDAGRAAAIHWCANYVFHLRRDAGAWSREVAMPYRILGVIVPFLAGFLAHCRSQGPLRRNAQEFDQIAAQNRFLVRIAEERRVEDEINANGPVKGIVCPIHHVTDADFSD